MKKNTASPSRLNQIAKGYMQHHNAMKAAAASPAEETAGSPKKEQAADDSGSGDGPLANSPVVNESRKVDKLRKPKLPQA